MKKSHYRVEDITDPYSPNLAHFFTNLAGKMSPEERQLFVDWAVYPELSPFIEAVTVNDQVTGFKIRDGQKDAYSAKRSTVPRIPGF